MGHRRLKALPLFARYPCRPCKSARYSLKKSTKQEKSTELKVTKACSGLTVPKVTTRTVWPSATMTDLRRSSCGRMAAAEKVAVTGRSWRKVRVSQSLGSNGAGIAPGQRAQDGPVRLGRFGDDQRIDVHAVQDRLQDRDGVVRPVPEDFVINAADQRTLARPASIIFRAYLLMSCSILDPVPVLRLPPGRPAIVVQTADMIVARSGFKKGLTVNGLDLHGVAAAARLGEKAGRQIVVRRGEAVQAVHQPFLVVDPLTDLEQFLGRGGNTGNGGVGLGILFEAGREKDELAGGQRIHHRVLVLGDLDDPSLAAEGEAVGGHRFS